MIIKNHGQPEIYQASKFSVAPMLDWTDKHCRYFHRLLSRHAVLYTEMVTTGALIRGDHARFLEFNLQEAPVVLQLGGSQPAELSVCAKLAEEYGYAEVNLNVGCPSDKVQNGRFGACLMAQPQLVAECIAAMQQVVDIPVSVKCRIGIDEQDSYAELHNFISQVAAAGCKTFIVHARKAWLSGLSPKQNRELPPLRYEVVFQLKQDFPQLQIIINGGITQLPEGIAMLAHVDGVMVGREAYHNPYCLSQVDALFYQDAHTIPSRHDVVHQLLPYVAQQLSFGVRLHSITRHILGLFHGEPGARAWRRYLSEHGVKPGADSAVLVQALNLMQL